MEKSQPEFTKAKYEAPKLIRYGDIRVITQNSTIATSRKDANPNRFT